MKRTFRFFTYVSFFVACFVSGCGPVPPSSQELGRVVFKESEVPGADKPYVLPGYLQELKANAKTMQGRPPEE